MIPSQHKDDFSFTPFFPPAPDTLKWGISIPYTEMIRKYYLCL